MTSPRATDRSTRAVARPRDMALTLFVALGAALGISAITGRRSLWGLLVQGMDWPVQVAWGAVIGLLLATSLMLLVKRVAWLSGFRRELMAIVSRADLTGLNPVWFSLCAGFGEEMLVRGALQPIIGIWLASVIFTALHFRTGGFQTMNPMKALYALLVFLVSLLLGSVCLWIGLVAAIVTHVVADVIFLTSLRAVRC